MSELDRAVLRHVEQRPASPLVLIPTSSHTVDFAAAQLCSLRTVGWQPAALVVCWDRDACSVLRDAHLPAVLEEVGGGGKGTAKGKGAGGFHFQGPHKLGGKAHPYIPTGVFHHAGRALQWLKFYLLHRVTAAQRPCHQIVARHRPRSLPAPVQAVFGLAAPGHVGRKLHKDRCGVIPL